MGNKSLHYIQYTVCIRLKTIRLRRREYKEYSSNILFFVPPPSHNYIIINVNRQDKVLNSMIVLTNLYLDRVRSLSYLLISHKREVLKKFWYSLHFNHSTKSLSLSNQFATFNCSYIIQATP